MMPYQRTDWTSISRHQDQNHFIQVRNSLVWRKSKSSPLHYLAHKSRLSAQGDVLSVALQLQKWSMWATPGDGNLMFEQDAGKSRARMKSRNGQSASYVLIQHHLFLMRRAFKTFAKYPKGRFETVYPSPFEWLSKIHEQCYWATQTYPWLLRWQKLAPCHNTLLWAKVFWDKAYWKRSSFPSLDPSLSKNN